MPREHKGSLNGTGRSFAIVASRYSKVITEQLVGGAIECLTQHGCSAEAIEVFWVPGSFELPLVARRVAQSGRFDAVLALGCVIRGQTTHHEYIAKEVAQGLSRIAWETGRPAVFGVITAETMEQAIERAGTKQGNKGWDAVAAAIETVNVLKAL